MRIARSALPLLIIFLSFFSGSLSYSGETPQTVRGPGEGLWRPGQIELPAEVSRAFLGVVRLHPHDMRFRLTLYDTPETANAAQKVAHATDKEFSDSGGVVWPLILTRPQMEKICSVTGASLSPGVSELCRALKTSNCNAYPCTIMTDPMASFATGVAVARLADGTDVVLTAYHVARESIEQNHRTDGQYTLSPIRMKGMTLDYSSDPLQRAETYHTVPDVYLLANASEKDFLEGKDWALIGIPSAEAPGLITVPLASKPPSRGDPLWILGFPFRTRRPTADILGYSDASSDFRVSYGLAMGGEDLGTHPPFLLTNADIVSGNSGGPVINSAGEVVAIVHVSVCKPDGAIDLGTVKFCGITLATGVDAVNSNLLKPTSK